MAYDGPFIVGQDLMSFTISAQGVTRPPVCREHAPARASPLRGGWWTDSRYLGTAIDSSLERRRGTYTARSTVVTIWIVAFPVTIRSSELYADHCKRRGPRDRERAQRRNLRVDRIEDGDFGDRDRQWSGICASRQGHRGVSRMLIRRAPQPDCVSAIAASRRNSNQFWMRMAHSRRSSSKPEITSQLQRAAFDELTAQVERALVAGIPVSHFDSHQHIHTLPLLFPVLKALQRRFGIRRVRSTINLLPPGQHLSPIRWFKKRLFCHALRWHYRTASPDGTR